MPDTTTSPRPAFRPVDGPPIPPRPRVTNCYIVSRQDGGTIIEGRGCWGRPQDAIEAARNPMSCPPWAGETVIGISIHDVRTGERWFVPV